MMNRKEFIKLCTFFGVGTTLGTSLTSFTKNISSSNSYNGKVLIIGAGPGGLSAGYFLNQLGIDFEILEASSNYGGRIKINNEFADFPIPLGAEWIHTRSSIFSEIVNDPSVEVDIETIRDAPDRKFVNYSWFNFFEDYIVPSISDKISYNERVKTVDYSKNEIEVTTQNSTLTADKVIISVPLKILQERDISFQPSLPEEKLKAIDSTRVWDGFKAFIEFKTKFYRDEQFFKISPKSDGQKLYYNACYGQNSDRNILGLFTVGTPAKAYLSRSGNELKQYLLDELDTLYNNQASAEYIKHITQNWNSEPFIKGAYMSDHANWRTVNTLGKPTAEKVYFAGGEYTDGKDWVSVHAAARSAKATVQILNG